MEKTATGGTVEPQSTAELFGIMQGRIAEQDEKIGLLLEIINYQNKAIKSAKAIDAGLMENVTAADICVKEYLADALEPSKEADKEAA